MAVGYFGESGLALKRLVIDGGDDVLRLKTGVGCRRAWNYLADDDPVLDLDFAGPIDRFESADAYQQAIRGLSQMKTDIIVHRCIADGPDVITWYDLHTRIAPPAPVAEWSRVDNGKITRVRVVFDPRPFAAAAAGPPAAATAP